MVELAYERAQLRLGQLIEGQEVAECFLDVVNDGLLDEGPDPCGSIHRVQPIHVLFLPSWPFAKASLKSRGAQTSIIIAASIRRSVSVSLMAARGSST